MKDREIHVDNGWVTQSPTTRLLAKEGYSVGGYIDNGVPKYVLFRLDGTKFGPVHEFSSPEELNNMVKLLIPPEG